MTKQTKSLLFKLKLSNSKTERKVKGKETTTKILPPSLPREGKIKNGLKSILSRTAPFTKLVNAKQFNWCITKHGV